MRKILALSGSIRNASTNYRLLEVVASLYKDILEVEIYDELASLPHFDPDIQGEYALDAVKQLLQKIDEADGVIISSPEYVFSPPAILKNALEWTVAETVFSYKPTALIVASSAGEKAFESLDLILKTLVQEPIPDDQKLHIRGVRAKVTTSNPEDLDSTLLADIRKVVDALIVKIKDK